MLTGAKPRVVPKRERASCRVRREIIPQPSLLRRANAATANLRTVAVQGDDVPRSVLEAVVPLTRIAGGRAEIIEVCRSTRGLILMVPRCWTDSRLKPAPGGVETITKISGAA